MDQLSRVVHQVLNYWQLLAAIFYVKVLGMCGRFTLHHSTKEIAERFVVQKVLFETEPRYNIAPGQAIAVVTQQGPNKERRLDGFKWGLVPFWAKDPSIGNKMINARAESLTEKASFKYALTQRRCLIPADGFYEWKQDGHTSTSRNQSRQPMHIHLKQQSLFAFAGLWEEWRPKEQADAKPLRTCTIITTTPNKLLATMHHRMAVILRPEDEAAWLDPNLREPDEVLSLLRSYPDEEMAAFPVAKLINTPAFDAPDCILPLEAETTPQEQGSLFA
jgi:putative SOS response-associated peptidase YedK